MAAHIGRTIKKNEHVHHVNGDKADNRLQNLMLLSPKEHYALHARTRYIDMRKISKKVLQQLEDEPQICARRNDSPCGGRITYEHSIIYAGRQLDETWAIIKLCECHHGVNTYQDGGDFNKERNIQIALNRATDDELRAISKSTDYLALRDRLNNKYGD